MIKIVWLPQGVYDVVCRISVVRWLRRGGREREKKLLLMWSGEWVERASAGDAAILAAGATVAKIDTVQVVA
jgi:hypothetical protein